MLLQLACLFDNKNNTMLFANGKLYKRCPIPPSANTAGFLIDSMFDFAEQLNKFHLNDHEMALFCAATIVTTGERTQAIVE